MTKKMDLTPLEKWERLTFADNFIFCKVLEDNPDVCKELLELLLDIKIERIEQPVSERYFKTDFDSRGIRFDVYVKDENGRSFDIEIQTSHNTNLAKRARYYQGLIDVDNLQSGEDYNALKESYVIFLCLGDAFGKKLPKYTFRYRADENEELFMNDGTVNIFFNALEYDKMQSKLLKSFFKFLCGQEPSSAFTDRLSLLVERAKHNAQWRHKYMTWEQEMKFQSEIRARELAQDMAKDIAKDMAKDLANDIAQEMVENIKEKTLEEGFEEGRASGLSEGQTKKLKEQISKKIAKGKTDEQIADEVELSLEETRVLIKQCLEQK